MKNWKTTACGILTIIGSVCALLVPALDGDPKTNPDFQTHATLIVTALAGLGLIAASDKKPPQQ